MDANLGCQRWIARGSVTVLAECVLIESVPVELHVITNSREQEEEVCRLTRSGASSVNARLISSGGNPLTGRRTVERRQEADPMCQEDCPPAALRGKRLGD